MRRTLTLSCLLMACSAPSNTPKPRKSPPRSQVELDAARADAQTRRSRATRVESLARLPSERTSVPSEACERMVTAHRAFTAKTDPNADARGSEARRELLMSTCVSRPIEVTLCQAYALEHLGDDEADLLTAVMNTCTENFGSL